MLLLHETLFPAIGFFKVGQKLMFVYGKRNDSENRKSFSFGVQMIGSKEDCQEHISQMEIVTKDESGNEQQVLSTKILINIFDSDCLNPNFVFDVKKAFIASFLNNEEDKVSVNFTVAKC